MTAAAPVELGPSRAFGNCQRRTRGAIRVVLTDDEQDRAADVGRLSDRSLGGDAEERASGDPVLPSVPSLGRMISGRRSLLVGDGAELAGRRRRPGYSGVGARAVTKLIHHADPERRSSCPGREFLVPARPSTSGFWAIGAAQAIVRGAELDGVKAGERRAPDEHPRFVDVRMGDRQIDDRAVVRALGGDRSHVARLALEPPNGGSRTDRCESLTAERHGERREPPALTAANPCAITTAG